ncbi:MAG: hydrogenase maturation peptidase HycI [Euryarchaeota archaeon]|nr:hydrogenase maturation peptidase HycI [Euryarchaeota archaeon]
MKHLVVLGMGNELRGDDAVGLAVVHLLKPRAHKNLTVFDGQTTPEMFIKPICEIKPSHVLIVDAAELQAEPGTWRLLSKDEIDTGLFTTHIIPVTDIAKEIEQRCGAQVGFLGIQPKSRDVSLSLSDECKKAAQNVASEIIAFISKKKEE